MSNLSFSRLAALAFWGLASLATLTHAVIAAPSQPSVGLRTLPLTGMPVTVVYPTEATPQSVQRGPFLMQAAQDATPTRGLGRLVVLSHGTGGHALPDFDLAAALARAGFVVAMPRHRGDHYEDFSASGPASWKTRPAEVSETIDLLQRDPQFGPLLDTQRVGVHGMSAGGGTALTMAGARWRMLSLIKHCTAHWDEDLGFCANGLANQPDAQGKRRAQMQSAVRAPSEWFLPSELTTWQGGGSPNSNTRRPDPRVAAVTAAVPVAAIFSPESLRDLPVPVGVIQADADTVLLPRFHSQYLMTQCGNCSLLMRLPQAGHFDVLSPWPATVASSVAAQQVRGGLPTGQLSPEQRTAMQQAIVQFYRQQLR